MLHVFYLLLTQVANHKTAQSYGPASVTLSEELYKHLQDYMDQSKCLPGREKGPATAFFNRLGGTYERMGDNFTREWRRFGLPGSPTLSDIRTAISTAVCFVFCQQCLFRNKNGRENVSTFTYSPIGGAQLGREGAHGCAP